MVSEEARSGTGARREARSLFRTEDLTTTGRNSLRAAIESATCKKRSAWASRKSWSTEKLALVGAVYSPELVVGDVVFTDYEMILGKPTEAQWLAGSAGSPSLGAKSKSRSGQESSKG
jgi:hypothetical protein